MRYAVEIRGADQGLRARVILTHAILDLSTGKTVAVPEDLLGALRQSGALNPSESQT
jgi:acyl-CoA thioesterase FadM